MAGTVRPAGGAHARNAEQRIPRPVGITEARTAVHPCQPCCDQVAPTAPGDRPALSRWEYGW